MDGRDRASRETIDVETGAGALAHQRSCSPRFFYFDLNSARVTERFAVFPAWWSTQERVQSPRPQLGIENPRGSQTDAQSRLRLIDSTQHRCRPPSSQHLRSD